MQANQPQHDQKRDVAILVLTDSSESAGPAQKQRQEIQAFTVAERDPLPDDRQLDIFDKMTPEVLSKRRPMNEQTNKQDQIMSSAYAKKTPDSILASLESETNRKDVQLRTVERTRVAPLEEQMQNDSEAKEGRLQLTPMILQSKPCGDTEGNGCLAGTDRPKRKTRNLKNSRYDGADYLVDFSGSGQHNRYKLRKGAEAGGDEALSSNGLALTMNVGSTGEQTKQMPTEASKKQMNRRLQKQVRKDRERNQIATRSSQQANESQELLNQIQEITIGKEDLMLPKLRSSTRSRKSVTQFQ